MAEAIGFVNPSTWKNFSWLIPLRRPIASAVIVPDQVPDASKSFVAGTKRRFSIETESEAKRPKVDENLKAELKEGSPTSRRSSIKSEIDPLEEKKNTNPERRKSSVQEERKRGQRLFGGLLSTLSQSTPNGQQKRRQEIEKRQQEKAKQQKAEDEGRRTQKLADLKAVRKAEQIKFDGKSVCSCRTKDPMCTNLCLDADKTYEYVGNGTVINYQHRTETCKWRLYSSIELQLTIFLVLQAMGITTSGGRTHQGTDCKNGIFDRTRSRRI